MSPVSSPGHHQHPGGAAEAAGELGAVGAGGRPAPAGAAVPGGKRRAAALRVRRLHLQVGGPGLSGRCQRHAGKWCSLLCLLCRLIQHTKALMSAEEKLCIKVLRTLQEMLIRTLDFDEKVRGQPEAQSL